MPSDGPMSDDETVLRALADIREPAVPGADLWAEFLLALALGLLLALAVSALLRLVLAPRPTKPRPLSDRIAEAQALPDEARLVALARLARESGTTLPDDLRTALYRPLADAEAVAVAARLEAALPRT